MKNTELEIYKGFFNRVENIIKDYKEVSDEEKLIVILIELKNMIMYKSGGVSKEIDDFIQKLRIKLNKCKTNHDYFKNGEMKSYSKDAEEFARKRVDYEMSYTSNMDFTDAQIEWIKNHIYISVRNAYQSAVDKWRNLHEVDYDTGVIGDKVLDRPLTEKPEEVAIYRTEKDKKLKFPCQSCTKVDKMCIPTDFVGGGCGKCPKYEDRVWAKILNDKNQIKDRYLTNKELSMWLSKGNGLLMDKGTGRKSASYDYWEEDKIVDYMNLAIRKWEDNEWHEPTYNYILLWR